jgi:hypothetical protein
MCCHSATVRVARVVAVVALALVVMPNFTRAAETAARPRTRAHNAEFVMPEGWGRGNNEYGNLILVPPDVPRGERVEIHIAPFDLEPRGVRGHAMASVGNFQGQFTKARVEQPIAAGRLPCGADTATVVVSGSDPQAPDREVIVLFTEVDGGGGSSQGVALVASSRDLFAKYRPAYLSLLEGMTLPSRTPLVDAAAGAPALTMYTVQTVTDFIEWALDVPFTEGQRDALREHFVTAWRARDKGEIEGVAQITAGRAQLDKLTDANKKELARQAIRAEVMKVWRAEAGKGDAMAKMMVEIYDAAHTPLVAGDPPITRQSTDATLEVLHFMASHVAGAPADVAPSAEQKEHFARNLSAAYAGMPAGNREELAKMPTYWAALRCAWPELAADERQKLTAAWAGSEQVKPIVEQIRAAQAKAAEAAAPTPSSSSNSDPLATAKAMQNLYQQHENFVMLSNMSHQMHMSRMQIINNIGSSNYRYEYRYRYR